MKNILKDAELRIKNEMEKVGFICDSDNTDRYLDNLSKDLAKEKILKGNDDIDLYYKYETEIEELAETILNEIKENIMCKYKKIYRNKDNGDCELFYYNADVDFESIEEFYRYFKLGE